ncbi:MAG: iron ABC transporter permease [Chromatiales bacterium]|nr:iron ABC transporter permease [Chromatiales bacterium]
MQTVSLKAGPSEARLSVVHTYGWRIAAFCLAAVVAAPLLLVFSGWLQPENQVWQHLAETVLGDLVINTLVLLIGVAIGVLLIGVSLAWLTTLCEFPGRRFFDWALMLPLAVPAYVLAFVFLGVLDFSGPVQTWMRELFGNSARLGNVRSTAGVITVMVLVLYPYVYMLTRSAFLTQGSGTLEAARILGLGPWGAFFRVALPMARPAIVAGTSLALMETLADFGTVAVFNYDTFTTAIYKAWFGLFNLQAASQLASLLLIFVAIALVAENRLRGRAQYHETTRSSTMQRHQLRGVRAWLATGAASLVFGFAFVLPLIQLLLWAAEVFAEDIDGRYLDLLFHTLLLGSSAGLVTVTCALIIGFVRRRHADLATSAAVRVATLGYALPGSVLAVGVMLSLTGIDGFLNLLGELFFDTSPGPILGGTVIALLMAYMVRFLAVAYGPIESGLKRIRPSLSEAARSLGANSSEVIRRVYLPLLRPGLLTALLLVIVDVMKEMPATLLLRPFGWDTVAVRIYEMTSEGEWERAALPSVTLILVGLLPVLLLVKRSGRHQTEK